MQKHTFNVLGVLLATALLVLLCVGAVAAADWPTYMGNDGRTGYTSEEGPVTNNVLWEIDAPTPTDGKWGKDYAGYEAPIIADGKIYVSSYHIISGYPSVFCYDMDTGKEIWSTVLTGTGGARCSIALSEKYLYVADYDGSNSRLVCLNRATGEKIGQTDIIATHSFVGLSATPLIVGDMVWINTLKPETILYGYKESDFISSGSNTVQPTYTIPIPNATGAMYASPSTDGNLIFVPGDGGVMAFNKQGVKQWTVDVRDTEKSPEVSTPVYHNGNISIYAYYPTKSAKLYSINVTRHEENWNCSIDNPIKSSSPAVSDSMIVVGTSKGISVYSLDGIKQGDHTGKTANANTPIIAGNTIYYGTNFNGIVYAVDATTRQTIWEHKQTATGKLVEGSLAVSNGRLFYGDTIKFYAIGEPTSLFDGNVKLGTEKVDIDLNDGVNVQVVKGTSVMAAIHAAAEKGGFDYNVTYEEGKFSLKGFAGINNNTKCSWVVYSGKTPIDINTYSLKDGDTLNIYFCKYVDGEWDTDNARPTVTITVDVPAEIPTSAEKIYEGIVSLKADTVSISKDESSKIKVKGNTVLGILDAAAKAGGFTYNVTYSDSAFTLKDISGNDGTWTLYINGVKDTGSTTIDKIIVNDGDHVAFYNGDISNAQHYVIITAKEKPSSFTLTLKSGWNFVSVPQTLATDSNTVEKVFGSVLGEGGVLAFNGETQSWVQATKDTVIKPLEAYWVDAKAGTSVNLYYNTGDPTVVPSSKKLHEGWNAVGISADDDITVDEFLGTYNNWQAIIPWNSVSQDFASQINKGISNTQTLEQGAGNWLYITSGNSLVGSL